MIRRKPGLAGLGFSIVWRCQIIQDVQRVQLAPVIQVQVTNWLH